MLASKNSELWAKGLFGECDLGDKRRTKRLIKLATNLSEQIGKSVSSVCQGDEASLEASYRFIRNDNIAAQAISNGAYKAVTKEAKEREILLALEDTTTIGYYHDVVEKLGDLGGPYGGHKKGFLVHSILLVDPCKNQTVGLIEQNLWKRNEEEKGKKHMRSQRKYQEKESFKWEMASTRMSERLGNTLSRVISVCDREADIYDYLFYKCRSKQRFIVKAGQDRSIEGIDATLSEAFNRASALGHYELLIPQKGGRQGRTTKMALYSCEVAIKDRRNKEAEPLCMNMVVAIEATNKVNKESIRWILLTSEPSNTYEEAKEVVKYYSKRWHIEEFHKAWKTGAGAERQRMQSANNLERMLVILSFIAVRLLQLREVLEHGDKDKRLNNIPCTTVLSTEEFKVLWFATERKLSNKKLPKVVPNLEWAYQAIAKLGGWNNSKRTGRASWLTIWHGWFRLQERLEGYRAAQL